jgi:hypothetical protein
MNRNQLDNPVIALSLAVGLALLAQQAKANAARALGVPISAVALLGGGAVILTGIIRRA